jgi:hypothetical protein
MADEIDIRKLQRAVNQILDHVVQNRGVQMFPISPEQDFYWDVPGDRLHAVKEAQPNLDVGRLTDDWGFVEQSIGDKDAQVSLMLVHIAPLLRKIGESVGQ